MSPLINVLLGIVLLLHGLIHLMGTAVYMRFTTINGFPYKTTLLGGGIDLGASGISAFGLVWLLAGAGTVISAGGLLARMSWAPPVLLISTMLSLVLCLVDWEVAKAGAIIDLVILVTLVVGPRLFSLTA